MKSPLPVILILLLIALSGPLGLLLLQNEEPRPIELKVMCFNIRNGYGKDGENHWKHRKDFVAEVIANDAPDVAGLQEVFHFQLNYLLEQLPGYLAVGEGRDGGKRGEHCSILYRADRYELIDTDTFWLSDTPDVPSKHWGNGPTRICTWAWLKDLRTGRSFFVYNTHLDHISEPSRRKSVELIMATLAERSPEIPFVLCGDFNAGEDTPVVNYLKGTAPLDGANPIPLVDTWRVIHPDNPECGTVSRFTGSMEPWKIDHIFVAPDHEVLDAEILRMKRKGRDASDHYPLNARVRLR